ncbi:MAG: hypothetical protein JW814_07045 [Candidatus Krumholzibacteriota bacterium]|nr:hypothetical protein [Candidatus Krumholzibacteriota bacterium]
MRICSISRSMIFLPLIVSLLAGCGKGRMTGREPADREDCLVIEAVKKRADSIRVALFDNIDPADIPFPRNGSERFLFGNLYESLIKIDCRGQVSPSLASRWESTDRGRCWRFELDREAVFWNGTAVTANDVIRCWDRDELKSMFALAGIDSFSAEGATKINIYLMERSTEVPRALASEAFSVYRRSLFSRWPLGTGDFRVVERAPKTRESDQNLAIQPAFSRHGPFIDILTIPVEEARDILESSIDLLVTGDQETIDFAVKRGSFITERLPWSSTYMLLSTSRVRDIRLGRRTEPISPGLRENLAHFAIRCEARASRPGGWWDRMGDRRSLSSGVKWPPVFLAGADIDSERRRIVYDINDETSRDIAERLVALAGGDPDISNDSRDLLSVIPDIEGRYASGVPLRAEGLAREDLDRSVLSGDDFAYIIKVARNSFDPSFQAGLFMEKINWVSGLEGNFSKALLTLADTRETVIARKDAASISVDWSGRIIIMVNRGERR